MIKDRWIELETLKERYLINASHVVKIALDDCDLFVESLGRVNTSKRYKSAEAAKAGYKLISGFLLGEAK
jgi:hypothetical protein